ncbi:MAG: methionine--tRNA ligase [Phycisphaeraceae bacterium]
MTANRDNTFYITTPIYYVNARPHIGHIYTTTIADVIARYQRLAGRDVFFLTGTDEHGKKVADAAREQGQTPQQYVDAIAGEFQQTFDRMAITCDDFIRTTQDRHQSRLLGYVQRLIASGDVYLGEYEGWYDEGQEEYVTETNARASGYKSAISGKPLTRVKEKNYFFRLSRFQQPLIDHIEANPGFIQPDARRNEVLARVRDGLNDIAISRSTEPWGVPMPGDADHSIYVWIDALFNYLTAIEANDRGDELWPADVHLIGKEILWFHAVIWPAMLMALDKPLYKKLYAHSFWIAEGQKMSKSLGNFVDLEKLDGYVETFGLDALRYYLATHGPLGATDADFAEAKFIDVYNSDLANTVGNCASRVMNMIGRYCDGKVPDPVDQEDVFPSLTNGALAHHFRERFADCQLEEGIHAVVGTVRDIDGYIEQTQPFKLAKDPANRAQVGTILYNCAEALRIASLLLWPVMPAKMEELWRRIGCADYAEALADKGAGQLAAWTKWGQLKPGTPIEKAPALFPRHEPAKP